MLRRSFPSLLGFVLLWWTLTGPGIQGWIAGAFAVAGATFLFAFLGSPTSEVVRPLGLLGFLPYFLSRAVRGGIDVSLRAFSRGPRLDPALIRFPIRLPVGPARTLFVNTISLLPGTFSAELDGAEVTVHLLARDPRAEARLEELEERVARVFGIVDTPEAGTG